MRCRSLNTKARDLELAQLCKRLIEISASTALVAATVDRMVTQAKSEGKKRLQVVVLKPFDSPDQLAFKFGEEV